MLSKIKESLKNKKALNFEEAVFLFEKIDLMELREIAHEIKFGKNKDIVYWNKNLHINPTNICIGQCKFCLFSKEENQKDAYLLTYQEILDKIQTVKHFNIKEVHIVGGLNPKLSLEYYLRLFEEIKKLDLKLHIKALTAPEIDFFAKKENITIEECLKKLIESGLNSLPGGGAEIFSERIRILYCPSKIPAKDWLYIHETAHKLGLKSNATMLTGLGETTEEKIQHLFLLREQQEKSHGFQSFIPLVRHNKQGSILTAVEILRNIAVSRLILHNFEHIKAYRVQLGNKLTQLALFFGADDIDGTVIEEKITSQGNYKFINEEEIKKLIQTSGFTAKERNSLYEEIEI